MDPLPETESRRALAELGEGDIETPEAELVPLADLPSGL